MNDESSSDLPIEKGMKLQSRYRVEDIIGEGGFATVYKARDIVIDRAVAVKVLSLGRLEQEDAERAMRRFLREARVAARISHPGIVEVHDFGRLNSSREPFIVMECLEGDSLYHRVDRDGPLDPGWLLANYCQVLEALGEAHLQNVVHKDLKPGNIFIHKPGSHREVWKLVDFGVAHIGRASNNRITKTGFLSGTPQYLPPEYIEEQHVSPQMDVYQMALSLIEAITGEPVVNERKPFEAAMMHVEGDLDVPTELLEAPIGAVLQRALAFNPADRFETGHHFAQALGGIDPETVPSFGDAKPDPAPNPDTAKWAAIDAVEKKEQSE